MGIQTKPLEHYAVCDGDDCEERCSIFIARGCGREDSWPSPLAARAAAFKIGWRQIETGTGSKLLCRVCAAKADLPALSQALDSPGPVLDAVMAGVAKELAKEET